MKVAQKLATRRRVLEGIYHGAVVSVGLPFLDCFLDSKGRALASTGESLPVRFGTWFWGLGLCPGRWEPKATGPNFVLPDLLKVLSPFREQITILSGMRAALDGNVNRVHWSGGRAVTAGEVLDNLPSVDTIISGAIGDATRFRSLEVSATAEKTVAAELVGAYSWSIRNANSVNAGETSPLAFYGRIFGREFHDPNAAEFKPDPRLMARESALSAITESRQGLVKQLGAADRARLDQYFTSLRQLEHQIAVQLEKPPPLPACVLPKVPVEPERANSDDVEATIEKHAILVNLVALALACDQTRVANIYFTSGGLRRPGATTTHHVLTHEEQVDLKLGYQARVSWYEARMMENFVTMLRSLDGIKEGDGTLLDHSLILAFSEHGYAKLHTLDNIPMFLAGKAGGRVRTGMHIKAAGDPVTRVGLTIQQAMGLSVGSFGAGSMKTDRPFAELLV